MSAPVTRSQRSVTAFALFAAMALAPLAAQAFRDLIDTCPPNFTCKPPDKKPPIWDPNPPPNDGPKQCTPRGGGNTGCGGGGPAALSGGVGGGVQVGGGNPINLISGNKHQEEVDLAALPGVLGLEFTRRYNSNSSHAGMTGALWRHSYETVLYEAGNQIQIIQADGRRLHFARVPGQALCIGADLSQGQVRVETGPKGQLTYHWRWSDGRVLTFSGGRNGGYPLQRIQAATGEAVQLSYSPLGDLLEVKDPQGRRLRFIYGKAPSGRSSLAAVDTPLGRIEYRQDAEGRLTQVRHLARKPTGEGFEPSPHLVRQYHYEAQHQNGHSYLLTGISQQGKDLGDGQQAQRIATYAYNREGQAVLTVRGRIAERDAQGQLKSDTGVEQLDIRYVRSPGLREGRAGKDGEVKPLSFGEVELSNALGHKSWLKSAVIGGQYRLVEFRGAGCASCGPANRSYGYDSEGRLIRSTELDAQGRPLVSDLHKLDGEGRLIERSRVVYRAGKAQEPEWLQRLAYTDVKYRDGSVAVAQQAHEIRRPSVVPGKEAITRIERNAQGQITRVIESAWSPIDAEGREVPTAIERSTSYRYAQVGGHSVLMEIDGPLPNGPKGDPSDSDVTRLSWDARGVRLVALQQPAQASARYTHDDLGRLSQYIGADGVPIKLSYSAQGQLAQLDRAGAITRTDRDALGRLLRLQTPGGQSLRMEHDAAGQLASLADPEGNRIAFERNAESSLVRARLFGADGQAAQGPVQWADQGPEAALQGLKQLTGGPERSGNATAVATELVRPDAMPPDAATLLDQWIASSAATSRQAGPHSALDAQGRSTLYWHDDWGRLRLVSSPVTGRTQFHYDLAGRLLARVQQDGSRAQYQRDAAGRVVGLRAVGPRGEVDEQATVTWGARNRPVRLQFLAGVEQFEYDAAGRLKRHEQEVDGKRWDLLHEHNGRAQRVAQRLPGGEKLKYRYRGDLHPRQGMLEAVVLDGAIERPIVQNMNPAGEAFAQRGLNFGNGLRHERSTDSQGRVIRAGVPQLAQARLQYGNGNAAQGSLRTPAASSADAFASDEPIQVSHQQPMKLGGRVADQVGVGLPMRLRAQWLTLTQRLDTGTASPAAAGAAANFGDDAAPELDALGRQLRHGDLQLRHDSLGRLVEVHRVLPNGQAPEFVARYRYNLFGQRIAKTVAQAQGGKLRTTYFFHDGNQLVAEADEQGLVKTQYIWLNDKPVAMLRSGQLHYVHTDHRNAPLAVTDEARRVLWQAQNSDTLDAQAVGSAQPLGLIEFNLRGSNQYQDPETSLHYNTHRYYDAKAGRYLSPDPLGLAAGPDLYAFALGRPHTLNDPLGLSPLPPRDWSDASFADKLGEVFNIAVTKFPDALGAELKGAIDEALADLPTTVAIFAAWQVISATPIGWIVNGLMAVYAAYSLGSEAIVLAKALGRWVMQVSEARTQAQLCAAAGSLATVMSQLASNSAFNRINPAKAFRHMRSAAGGKKISEKATPTQNAKKTRERLDRLSPTKCFNPFGDAYNRAADKPKFEREFNDQLRRQQEAINRMSADEFLAARKAYDANKRNPAANASQAAFRQEYRKGLERQVKEDLEGQGFVGAELAAMTRARVESTMSNLAALHEPDMVAGGFFNHVPTCMADRSVNCSIGAQWGDKLTEMENYAKQAVRDGHGGARLTLEFKICPRR